MPGEGDPAGEFMNTCGEVHAFYWGLVDALTLIRPGGKDTQDALDEPQYYSLGTVIGHGIQIGVGYELGGIIGHPFEVAGGITIIGVAVMAFMWAKSRKK